MRLEKSQQLICYQKKIKIKILYYYVGMSSSNFQCEEYLLTKFFEKIIILPDA